MPDDRDSLAITAALTGNWKEAISINSKILKEDKTNVDALNRLGHAFLQTGQLTRAKRTFALVLARDPYNHIALKNSKKLSSVKKKTVSKNQHRQLQPLSFLEDPGKTKIANCVNLAPNQTLATLSPGDEVTLKPKNHWVELRTIDNHYVAALPDDISFKLIKLLSAGNTYQAVIKSVAKNSLIVMLRELSRGRRFASQPSFISSTGALYSSFSQRHVIETEKPDVTPTGETDEEEGATPTTEEEEKP